jgi:4'-phosphopantetheinyl transferase
MAQVYWLGQRLADVPPGSAWLSAAERETEALLRVPKRRLDWRLGRWTAKRALSRLGAGDGWQSEAHAELARLAVRPTPAGVPEAFRDGARVPWALSISHSRGRALVAIRCDASAVGCDIEAVEPRGQAFLEDSFTAVEREAIAASPAPELWATLHWSAKESAMKVLGEGLRLPLAGFAVARLGERTTGSGWRPLELVERRSARSFAGYWRPDGDCVLAILGAAAFAEPIALR